MPDRIKRHVVQLNELRGPLKEDQIFTKGQEDMIRALIRGDGIEDYLGRGVIAFNGRHARVFDKAVKIGGQLGKELIDGRTP